MDEVNEMPNSLIPAEGSGTICETSDVNRNQLLNTDCSDVQQTILKNGIDELQLQSKLCITQESSDTKCTVKQPGDSFCKSEQTPTNDISTLSRYPDETKSGTKSENSVPNVLDEDAYDSYSDSIETLKEISSNEELLVHEGELSDSMVQQIQLSNQQRSCNIFSDSVVHVNSESIPVVKCDVKQSENASAEKTFEGGTSSAMNGATCIRPLSLSLAKSFQYHDRNRSKSDDNVKFKDKRCLVEKERTQSDTIDIQQPKRLLDSFDSDDYTSMSKSLPKGTIMRKGDLIEFVASDLEDKIRHSSPISLTGSSVSSRRSSLRSIHSISSSTSTSMATSTASGMSRSPSSLYQQSPDDIPTIDPQAIIDLENQARLVADSIDLMMGNLRGSLHKMSAISVGCLDAYRRSVDITCDSVDSSIKSMYALMAKCEELSHNMEPVYHLAHQIREIKRLLDLFEAQLSDK